jgi:hypothetical protein
MPSRSLAARHRWGALRFLVGLVLLPALGCDSQPQIAGENRELIVSLATAVSARDSNWLEKNAQLMERHKAEGVLSEVEYQTFTAIVAQARAGDWDAAEAAIYALREGQEPTAEDRELAAQRKLAPHHGIVPKGKRPPR